MTCGRRLNGKGASVAAGSGVTAVASTSFGVAVSEDIGGGARRMFQLLPL
jgi:hypothetical protein